MTTPLEERHIAAEKARREALFGRPLSDKAHAFLAKSPTFIGRVKGVDFYEHPTLGDEHPLLAITPSGKFKNTCYYELPDVIDVMADPGLN